MQKLDERFKDLIHSYLPDWQYEQSGDQPEAAVLYAGWRLLEDTRARIARLPEKHEREFLNAWAMEPKPAEPMLTYAALRAPEGQVVPSGSEVYLSGSGSRLWRTTRPGCAESLTLLNQVLESPRLGKLIPLPPPAEPNPTRLFDIRQEGGQRYAVRFAHGDAFRSEAGCQVSLSLPECDPALLDCLADPDRVCWSLEGEEEARRPLEYPVKGEQTLTFLLPGDRSGTALLAELLPGYAVPDRVIGRVRVGTRREKRPCQLAVSRDEIKEQGPFYPFGWDPEPWQSCYLACPDVLSQKNAVLELSFTVHTTQWKEELPAADAEAEYRTIMLRMPPAAPPAREVRAEYVAWEYWNGSTWRPISGTENLVSVFDGTQEERRVKGRFRWPGDVESCEVKGLNSCWIRWRITRSDGMGYLPRLIYVPEIRELTLSAVLEGDPVELSVCQGLDPDFFSVTSGRTGRLFTPADYEEDSWWLRFDHGPVGEELSLFLALTGRQPGSALTVWESTRQGIRPLKLADDTEGLSHSGRMVLSGIRGEVTRQFGDPGWWLCIRDQGGRLSGGRLFPRLTALHSGVVCLRAAGGDRCEAGETVHPFRGGVLTGQTLTDSFGGAAPEEDLELLARAEQYRHNLGRGMSPQDVEELVRFRFRDVVRTRSRRAGDRMEVAVLMRDIHQHSAAFAHRREEITRLLEERTVLPTLGLHIAVREPNFYPVQAAVWLRPGADSEFQRDSQEVRRLLEEFLNPVTGKFRGDGWRIGDLPTTQELCSFLNAQLPHVTLVKVLLTAETPQGQEVECAQVHDPFALPVAGGSAVYEVRGEDMG